MIYSNTSLTLLKTTHQDVNGNVSNNPFKKPTYNSGYGQDHTPQYKTITSTCSNTELYFDELQTFHIPSSRRRLVSIMALPRSPC